MSSMGSEEGDLGVVHEYIGGERALHWQGGAGYSACYMWYTCVHVLYVHPYKFQ